MARPIVVHRGVADDLRGAGKSGAPFAIGPDTTDPRTQMKLTAENNIDSAGDKQKQERRTAPFAPFA